MIAVWQIHEGPWMEIASIKNKKKGGSFVAANDKVDWKPMISPLSMLTESI